MQHLTIPCRAPSFRPCRLYSRLFRHTACQVQGICPRHKTHEDSDTPAAADQPYYRWPGTKILLCIHMSTAKYAQFNIHQNKYKILVGNNKRSMGAGLCSAWPQQYVIVVNLHRDSLIPSKCTGWSKMTLKITKWMPSINALQVAHEFGVAWYF